MIIRFYQKLVDSDFILEVWGSSTKAPDIRRSFHADFKRVGMSVLGQHMSIFNWLMSVASEMVLPEVAISVANLAIEYGKANM